MQTSKPQPPPRTALAQVLTALRQEHDWSQTTLSRRARLGANTVARIEADMVNRRTKKIDTPKPATLIKLADALGDGNPERARDARQKLFVAAGYSEAEVAEPIDPAEEMAQLRNLLQKHQREIDALRRRVDAPTGKQERLEEAIATLLEEDAPATVALLKEALRRLAPDALR